MLHFHEWDQWAAADQTMSPCQAGLIEDPVLWFTVLRHTHTHTHTVCFTVKHTLYVIRTAEMFHHYQSWYRCQVVSPLLQVKVQVSGNGGYKGTVHPKIKNYYIFNVDLNCHQMTSQPPGELTRWVAKYTLASLSYTWADHLSKVYVWETLNVRAQTFYLYILPWHKSVVQESTRASVCAAIHKEDTLDMKQKVSGFSWVTRSWFMERDIFLWHLEHHEPRAKRWWTTLFFDFVVSCPFKIRGGMLEKKVAWSIPQI